MSDLCYALHHLVSRLRVHSIPFVLEHIPSNGIYVLYEDGEKAHGMQRIVRIGTHTGNNRLRARLSEHFLIEKKDRSVFRQNIGRAILNRDQDPFLTDWNLDLTPAVARRLHGGRIDFAKQRIVEEQVTAYMQAHFRFAVFRVDDKELRLHWESRMISTVSGCKKCKPSAEWLGRFSPKSEIKESGLWQVKELYKEPFSQTELSEFERAVASGHA